MQKDILKKEKEWLLKEKYSGRKSAAYNADVKRLESGQPLAYVIGHIFFLGCTIGLKRHPLIPRPETEWWVEKIISQIKNNTVSKKPLDVLDIFSGSGCIGLAILKHVPEAHVTFADKEQSCVEQILDNITLNNIESLRTKVVRSDMFASIHGTFDYIFTNPPYIAESRKNTIQDSVLAYEPRGALFAGDDGLFYIRKLIANAPRFLKVDGKMYVEFDTWQRGLIESVLSRSPSYEKHIWHTDQYGKPRMLELTKQRENDILSL